MVPIPETVSSLLLRRQFAPDTPFTEKAIALIIFAHGLATTANGATISNCIHLHSLVDNLNTGDPSPCRLICQCDPDDPISLPRRRRDTRVVQGTVRPQNDEPVRFESEN
ncbi:hypothetical protein N7509_008983 [Penicillium cosmopolitanum]|uniref:Uncharacterized protein n=1 Tax=Penicillium cosmopolitanum TaxID=1131564 RepID=A0A9W9VNN3_9EURO|nr:uncharacterized protein N7509_008983 [Penicillium cosmopolitanum]KAJ5386442.1 hypothetical protein N7509_008983 [Penicillium cosmopolitanum]